MHTKYCKYMTTENKQNVYAPKGGETPIIHISGDQLNTKTEKGCYQVEMNHNDIIAAGLPADTCSAGHFIIGYLFVSETGSHGTSQSGRTVGQTLLFGGCTDATPSIYQRTGSYPRKTLSWSKWTKTVNDAVLKDELKEQGEKLKNEMLVPVKWGSASHINHYVTQGIYNITGERLNAADGLPIANSNPGHTIHARLLVLNSSIAGTGDVQDKCITQVLTLSNRTGGDGDVYIRTGQAHSTNMLAGGIGWEQWGKLQQNVEVGQVTSLNSYIGNGIYSGVYTDGSSFFETFVMVVINNYAVAGATGTIRRISQFKYALNVDGTFSYKTRSGYGNTGINWNDWVDLNGATTVMLQDGAVTAQKLSADVREKVENPLRPLYIAAGAEYNDTGADKTKTAPWGETVVHKAGYYYLNGLGDITEEQMMVIYNEKEAFNNIHKIRGNQYFRSRTFLIPATSQTNIQECYIKGESLNFTWANCSSLEILKFANVSLNTVTTTNMLATDGSIRYTFYKDAKLRIIYPINVSSVTSIASNTFEGCTSLTELRVFGLNVNLPLDSSPSISKDSVLYIINNASPTSAITITLHPDAYSRLADDADIVAALEAQPFISLVSA